MLKTRFGWIILLMMAALLGSGWIVASKEPAQRPSFTSLPEAPIVGHPAPQFTAQTPEGESVSLSQNLGTPIVLNFWATWCGPCRIEMPHFQRGSERFNGRIAFLGVNQGENMAAITDFQDEFGLTYPLLGDEDNRVNHLYNIHSLPTTIFINADGVVQEVVIGTINEAVLEDRIDALLESGD